MKFEKADIDKLIPATYNPRKDLKPRDKEYQKIKNSIQEFGYVEPIIVNTDNTIIGGHQRVKVLKDLGYNEIDVIKIDIDKTKEKALNIALNKITGEWDYTRLSEVLEELKLEDFDLDITGFDLAELDDILGTEKEVEEDDYEIVVPEETKAKYGDIYQLGNHRLMCGDSTKEEDFRKLLKGKTIKTVFTSPPYNINSSMYESYKDNLESQEYIDFNLKVVKNIKKHLKGFLFWNISYNKNARSEFLKIALEIGNILNFKEMIVWNKKKAMPIRSKEILTRTYEDIFLYETADDNRLELINLYETEKGLLYNKSRNKIIRNYWEINVSIKTQLDNHKACFPVKLPGEGIKLTTIEKDDVLDPFGGSGSTLIACEQLDRNCYMMELDPRYIDVIIDRWEKFTGRKAIKL